MYMGTYFMTKSIAQKKNKPVKNLTNTKQIYLVDALNFNPEVK